MNKVFLDVLNYKKPAFWMILLSIVAAIVVAICFMTNPKSDSSQTNDSNSWEIVEIEGEADSFVTSAADLYDTGGYGWYECQTSGYYYFNSMGNIYDNKSPRKEERLVWKVFITDEPLYDTPTGIPANWERLYKHADGTYIEAGQYIIVSCSQNSKSYGYGLFGDDEALFTGELR